MAETIEARFPFAERTSSVPYNSVCAPSKHSSSSPSALSSLYVTFKVLQLVNAFRKRVKTRVQSSKEDLVAVQQDFCQAFERQAYAEIDRRLGRKRVYPGLTCRQKPFGDYEWDFAVPHAKTANLTTQPKARAAKRIDWLLEEINPAVTCHEDSLVTVAKSNTLFLTRCTELQARRLSLKQLAHLIAIVKDLLATLGRVAIATPKPKYLTRGTEIIDPASDEYWLDETQLANLHHLLLCLQDQLLRQLVARCLELVRKHVVECQKDQGKRCLEWFSEFPDAQHPLSTTWPWSIKPSLAVLWGVCWMFYDYSNHTFDAEGNMLDAQGSIVVPHRVVQQYLSAVQRERQRQGQGQAQSPETLDISSLLALGEVGGRSIGLTDPFPDFRPGPSRLSSAAAPHQAPMAPSSRMATRSPTQLQQHQHQHQHQLLPPQQPAHQARSAAARDESWASVGSNEYVPVPPTAVYQAGTSGDLHVSPDFQARLALSGTNNASFAGGGVPAAPSAYVDSGAPATLAQHTPRHFLPEESFPSGLGYPTSSASPYHSTDAVASSSSTTAWSLSQSVPEPLPRPFYEQQSQPLPRRTRAQVTPPTIRITTDLAAQAASFASQPQDTIYSASSNSSLPHTEYGYNTTNYTSSGHLSPRGPSTYMPQDSDMQTPPRSPLTALGDTTTMGDAQAQQVSRKRSHSIMSQTDHRPASAHHSRAGSVLSNAAVSPADENSPRGSRAFKRGDPPVNNENKYVCDFSDECRGMVFDRKCEWSKHMDKHDRPYRCPDPSCAKLQGFTYSGGLLRHEREVHGKHGGPKAQLMCPVEDCKRHMGKGFTRKENLNEHLRRVHSFKDQQPSQGSAFRRDTQDSLISVEEAAAAAAAAATPASRISEAADFDEHSMISPALGKRKRSLAGASERATSEEVEDLKQELKRLRSETEYKDERIRQMEEERQVQGQKIHGLEEVVLRLQQQLLPPQHP